MKPGRKPDSKVGKRKALESIHDRRLRFFSKTYGNAKYSHLVRESLLREGAVRRFLLPRAKKVFGRRLKAVLLFGSAQQGLRKSWSSSDLDVIVVVDLVGLAGDFFKKTGTVDGTVSGVHNAVNNFSTRANAVGKHFGLAMSHGTEVGPFTWDVEEFKERLINSGGEGKQMFASGEKFPFQIIYGKKWLGENIPADFIAGRKNLKAKVLSSGRYSGRE